MTSRKSIVVAGAGSIGCFVGGMLASVGHKVALLARPRIISEISKNGLRLTSFEGLDRHVTADRLLMSDASSIFSGADIVLVTVKSADTAAMAQEIARHAPADATVVSLQNGVSNAAILRDALDGRRVLSGMVPFNVISLGEGRFHRATSGDIAIEQDAAGTAEQLSIPELMMRPTANMLGVQWGKLLLNLNNALNALSGLPLREQLSQRQWRCLLADQMGEALVAMRADGIVPVSSTPIPAGLAPYLLRLPDALFRLLAGRTIKIDPQARSSMWEDLQRHRLTEIDYLQGVIIGIAAKHGLQVPLTRRIVDLIKNAERRGEGSPGLTPAQIRG